MSDKHPIALWVEALESGEYEQARTCLREGDKFCCLGVANDIYSKITGNGYWTGDDFEIGPGDGAGVGLALSVRKWLEIGRNETYCMTLNDAERKSFKEIAAYLRETYPEHFA